MFVSAWLALAAVSAVHLSPALVALPPAVAVAARLCLLGAAALSAWCLRRRMRWRWVSLVFIVALYAAVSGAGQLASRLPPAQHGTSVRVLADVASVAQQRADHCRLLMRTRQVNGRAQHLLLEVGWDAEQSCDDLEPGSRWTMVLRLALPRDLANEGLASRERWWFRSRVDGRAWVRTEFAPQRVASSQWRAPIARLRKTLAHNLREQLPASVGAAYAPLAALTLGLGKPLPPGLQETLVATGTGHLFAISGLHVGLLAGLCLSLCRLLCWRATQVAPTRWPLLLALILAGLYAVLAGLTVPTQRALVALSVVLGARALGRELSAPRAVGLALFAVLAIDPLAPLDTGFWLSFMAVACLVLGRSGRPSARSVWRLLPSAQLTLTLGLLPLAIAAFGRVSVVAPLVNLLAVPVFAIAIVPISLTAVLLATVAPSLAAGPLWLAGASLLVTVDALDWCAAIPWGSFALESPSNLAMLIAAQLGVLAWLSQALPKRSLALACCVPLIVIGLWPWRATAPPTGAVRLTLLDVGQGLAAVIETRHHVLLYDAGPAYYSGSSAGARVVVPYLRERGVRALDRIVISHGDSDHDGGLGAVLRRYPDTQVLAGGGDTPWAPCRAGRQWRWDGVTFEILHPPSASWRGNDGSCVLRVSVGHGQGSRRVLLTGDIQARAEQHLVAGDSATLKADVVVAPHHGSASSSTAAFVAATAPRHALFATGYGNRWNFPREEVLMRWQAIGASTYATGTDGALTVLVRPGASPQVLQQRRHMRRYWSVP